MQQWIIDADSRREESKQGILILSSKLLPSLEAHWHLQRMSWSSLEVASREQQMIGPGDMQAIQQRADPTDHSQAQRETKFVQFVNRLTIDQRLLFTQRSQAGKWIGPHWLWPQ